nr:hypothetical protein [Tanacetum cinerariifolium]
MDASLVVTECSRTKSDEHITSSSSGTYITHVVDTDIRLVTDQEPAAEVNRNTTLDSTNMCHRGGEIDHDVEQDQVKSSLLKAEFLKTNDMVEKEVYNELSNKFLKLEKHCISPEISIQQKEESFQSNKPATKEKEKLKTKLEKRENSSKGLNKLLDSQLSANDKAGLRHDGAKESKVSKTITSVSKVKTSNSKTSNDKVEMPKIETIRMSEPIIEEWESDSKDTKASGKP